MACRKFTLHPAKLTNSMKSQLYQSAALFLSAPHYRETSEPPRFAQNGTLEFEFGMRWKKLFENHQKKLEELEKLFQDASETLEKEMERSIDDLEVNKIKQSRLPHQLCGEVFSNCLF